jgi:hypothetical protein
LAEAELAVEDAVTKLDAPRCQQIVQRRHIRAPGGGFSQNPSHNTHTHTHQR